VVAGVKLYRQAELAQVVEAVSSFALLAGLFQRWNQQRSEDCHHSHDDEQLDERERLNAPAPAEPLTSQFEVTAHRGDLPAR
jgi:hypothetical protein